MTMTTQQKLKYCYGAFAICVVTSVIPQMNIQTFAMIFSLLLLISFYVMRSKMIKDSFEHKEMSELIKTFWIWSAIYVVGIIVAGGLISSFGDMTAINQWTESVVQGTASPDPAELERVTQEYMATNFPLIISMTLICIAPSVFYAATRSKKAISRINNLATAPVEPIIT